jgi:hypothetical protein
MSHFFFAKENAHTKTPSHKNIKVLLCGFVALCGIIFNIKNKAGKNRPFKI